MEKPEKIPSNSVESVQATISLSTDSNPVPEEDQTDSQITVKKSVKNQKNHLPTIENISKTKSRPGPDGASEENTVKEVKNLDIPTFTYAIRDVETVSQIPGIDNTLNLPDVNVYQNKKTLAQGMMDLALFSANANQLRYVLESSGRHPYYYPSIVLISFSLLMQVSKVLLLCTAAVINREFFVRLL